MFAKAIVEIGGQALFDIRTPVINEDVEDIVVVIAMRGGCRRGCHGIHNKKEIRLKIYCTDWEYALYLKIFVVLVWKISQFQRIYQLRLCYSLLCPNISILEQSIENKHHLSLISG
jgi:hypothetical protein